MAAATEVEDVCTIAQRRYRRAAMYLGFWTALIFAMGVVLLLAVAFAVWAVTDFSRKEALSVTAVIGSIVQGGVLYWFIQHRKDLKEDERRAFRDVERDCATTKEAEEAAATFSFFGIR